MKPLVPTQIVMPATHRDGTIVEVVGVKVRRMPVVRYILRELGMPDPIGLRLFYECETCRSGCGCPSFSSFTKAVPGDVLQHLQAHTAFSH